MEATRVTDLSGRLVDELSAVDSCDVISSKMSFNAPSSSGSNVPLEKKLLIAPS